MGDSAHANGVLKFMSSRCHWRRLSQRVRLRKSVLMRMCCAVTPTMPPHDLFQVLPTRRRIITECGRRPREGSSFDTALNNRVSCPREPSLGAQRLVSEPSVATETCAAIECCRPVGTPGPRALDGRARGPDSTARAAAVTLLPGARAGPAPGAPAFSATRCHELSATRISCARCASRRCAARYLSRSSSSWRQMAAAAAAVAVDSRGRRGEKWRSAPGRG